MFSLALDDMSETAISSIASRTGMNKSALVRRCIAFALSEAPAIHEMSDREVESRALIAGLRAEDSPKEDEIAAIRCSIDAMHRLAQMQA